MTKDEAFKLMAKAYTNTTVDVQVHETLNRIVDDMEQVLDEERKVSTYWCSEYYDLLHHYKALKERCEQAGIPTNYGGGVEEVCK